MTTKRFSRDLNIFLPQSYSKNDKKVGNVRRI